MPTTRRAFQTIINEYYRHNARRLPWRETNDPYRIFVSEVMLQQTQAQRVVGKYAQFLAVFPDAHALCQADACAVLRVWQGLGYNRRAIALLRSAQRIVSEFDGKVPTTESALMTLPGIGPATAGAIAAFAYGQPTVFIETNIRRVYLHFYFDHRTGVRDDEILPIIRDTLDAHDPRRWYYALMDYGVKLRSIPGLNRRSAHYAKQSRFQGSNREARGRILRALLETPEATVLELSKQTNLPVRRVVAICSQLREEGLVAQPLQP